MKEFLTLSGKVLFYSIKDWNVTLMFWGIMLLIEVAINLMKK